TRFSRDWSSDVCSSDLVNIGIKQPINAILEAAEENRVDAIGMSGLLVKSTVVMKENLQEMNARGVATKYPVLLGGAALTRTYVENDLDEIYEGDVRYAKDAFEGLKLMDRIDRKSTRLNSSHVKISYAVFCLKK